MRFYRSTLLFLLGTIPLLGYSQTDSTSLGFIPNYIELGGLANTDDHTPFWLQTNQFGTVPRSGSALLVRGGFQHSWLLSKPDTVKQWRKQLVGTSTPERAWRLETGVEIAANVGNSAQDVLLPQAYGAIRYGNWELRVGRRKQWVGLADSTLGTGSYAWSGNALPIPKIQLGLTRFTAVPFTKGWFSVLGFYSDGWFEKGRAVTSELKFHQKQFYGRIGKANSKLKLYGGFNHQVQWGGKSPYETVNGQMPNGFKNYMVMIFGGGKVDTVNATHFDNANRVGNHLGSIDFAFEINGLHSNWFFYRQNIYEDGSLYRLTNIADGLNGVRIRRKQANKNRFSISEIVLEGLYTKSQGGDTFIFDQRIFGKDNYFNNAQVRDGWSYFGRTIGTPFITPTFETIWKFPNFGDSFTSNNRVWVLHTGLRGTFSRNVEWSTKLSYSSNNGVYDLPFPNTAYQFSGLLRVQVRTGWLGGNTLLTGSVAADSGDLYPNSYGLMLSLRKEGLFR
ncbi:capsule assembly Wzi family protein [Salmonirosea aquatica]|uniref:Capsule assembly Wzi family protein n=1 Tax=Salmonirosea aquatica TaxID=2654236 RepID=A0A7C9FZN4_9BACT|nr:hypothetical protein [Cytophagaceae bacterium SJW1-29]